MIRKVAGFVCFLLVCSTLTMGQKFTGKVFIDKNGNGLLDGDEQGVENVRVSDGLQVVRTDKAGNYSLPGHPRARFVFLTTPDGYSTTRSFYSRVGEKPDTIHFGIARMKNAKKEGATFLRMTDTETPMYGDWIPEMKKYAADEGVDFMIHTGDICYEDGMNFHARQINTSTMGVPVYYCIGNHDLVKGAYGEELYEKLFGPVFYSFDAGGVHFIVTPMASGDYTPSYTANDVYQWLKNDLAQVAPQQSIIVFNHDLLTYDSSFVFHSGKGESIDFNKYPLKAWIYGHWHFNFSREHGNSGIRSICSAPAVGGGIDNSASNFEVITVNKQGLEKIQRRYTYVDRKMALISPAANMPVPQNGKVKVSVNVYHTAATVNKVVFRLYDQKGHLKQSVPLVAQTDWNWSAAMQIPAGNPTWYTTIEATLHTGEVLYQRDTLLMNNKTTAITPGAAWPALLNNAQHNGALAGTNTGAPTLAWTTNIGGNIWKAAPVFADGKVFTATIDDEENKHCGITALDAKSGKVIWQYKTRNSIKNTITYADGTILGTDAEGITYALKAANGQLLWQHAGTIKSLPGFYSGGVADKGIYYTGQGGSLEALRIKDGVVVWTNQAWKGGDGTPAAMALNNNVLLSSANWLALFAHDAVTGKLLWKRGDEGIRFRSGTPAFYNNQLYVYGINKLHIIDPVTGKTMEEIPTSYDLKTMTAPVVTDKHIIVCTAANGMVAYDKTTKAIAWEFVPGEAMFYSAPYSRPNAATIEATPVRIGQQLYFGASDGYFYVLEEATGKLVAKYNLGSPVFAETAGSGNVIFTADFSGNVCAFTL
jgi:outer membrane protein assembly factor BamB